MVMFAVSLAEAPETSNIISKPPRSDTTTRPPSTFTVAVLENPDDNYKTSIWKDVIELIENTESFTGTYSKKDLFDNDRIIVTRLK